METRADRSPHRAALEALGIPEPALTRLTVYLDTLAVWSERVNLSGARTPAERVRVLVGAVLPAVALALPGRLIDVGSGNGSPGLVFALMRGDLDVTLLEPRKRRWSFLREAAREAGRPVRVLRERHDTHQGPPARTVTLRALALTLADVAPLVEPDGRVVWFGERPRLTGAFEEEVEGGAAGRGFHVYRRRPGVSRET